VRTRVRVCMRKRAHGKCTGGGTLMNGIRSGDADTRGMGVCVLDVCQLAPEGGGVPGMVPKQVWRQVSQKYTGHDSLGLVGGGS